MDKYNLYRPMQAHVHKHFESILAYPTNSQRHPYNGARHADREGSVIVLFQLVLRVKALDAELARIGLLSTLDNIRLLHYRFVAFQKSKLSKHKPLISHRSTY